MPHIHVASDYIATIRRSGYFWQIDLKLIGALDSLIGWGTGFASRKQAVTHCNAVGVKIDHHMI